MDLNKIIRELLEERKRLDRIVESLEQAKAAAPKPKPRPKAKLNPDEARERKDSATA